MTNKRVSSITLTILTESPIALSNDQGFGTYTPIKKFFYKNGKHAMTSVATFTYELRKQLILKDKLKPDDLVQKAKNIYFKDTDLEADIFGYLNPGSQQSKTSPIRIIPFISVNTYENDTQLITNRGFFDISLGRTYYEEVKKKDSLEYKELDVAQVKQTQALANEEVFGDYYIYTIILELDRIGVKEINEKGERLSPDNRIYFDKDTRHKIIKDILDVISKFTRTIKHETVHLEPLAVFGGIFEDVVPYFWNDIELEKKSNIINISHALNTIEDYDLEKEYHIISIGQKLKIKEDGRIQKVDDKGERAFNISNRPIKEIRNLVDKLEIRDDHYWYIKG
ncbi:MAG: type I-B CRISPR-associated protein Cas7/Cst2/DevR [Anaeromicrobium sp.]|jgi:CRISPR-associated protein Cas7/Cst2/DevR subtype I-B|uniref:type I-B CRISPR-associated protein Cas7/Cst2/DevR n=1 Tax=Anaeromicrobium sp. TaxID=1929132 RepID=UPI0025D7E40E|nr:type I-B CRISPR-associated protein Cas7/Cst2/DevR [Anaeromicrobium sp.]MCT4595727.1 type I-B CRISPR-associated protein Cas7/Cst2/DevR [Anaeromicrobium sp.]